MNRSKKIITQQNNRNENIGQTIDMVVVEMSGQISICHQYDRLLHLSHHVTILKTRWEDWPFLEQSGFDFTAPVSNMSRAQWPFLFTHKECSPIQHINDQTLNLCIVHTKSQLNSTCGRLVTSSDLWFEHQFEMRDILHQLEIRQNLCQFFVFHARRLQ